MQSEGGSIMTDQCYKPCNVAKILGCSRKTVYRRIKKGELKAFRIGTRHLRITASAIREFIKKYK